MKKLAICALLVVMLTCMCIGQQEQESPEQQESPESQVQKWKDHLSFVSPPLGQDATTLVPAFRNIEELPAGTHIVYNVVSEGTAQGADLATDMTLDLTIAGEDVVNGIDCVVVDLVIEMEMVSMGEQLEMVIQAKEWIDEDGVPVKLEEDATMMFGEFSIPISMTVERTGEEQYQGHDCWVLTGTQTTEIMGMTLEGGNVVEYIDKDTSSVVRVISGIGEEEADTGYMEPVTPVEELDWELGGTESITTPAGTYECQVISLEETGETVGTIWAAEEVIVPVKYTFSYRTSSMNLDLTMTLMEYTLG